MEPTDPTENEPAQLGPRLWTSFAPERPANQKTQDIHRLTIRT
ncbi:MAG: hypothetical protein A4E57_01894 [Syntrophorhabdaceae bacterium PtaU1.Bin034]|nr:MAG: hypothetical protein A4E57_01894 [Syntrophorhabdaceae bacterium PtaU1.Bin034]